MKMLLLAGMDRLGQSSSFFLNILTVLQCKIKILVAISNWKSHV